MVRLRALAGVASTRRSTQLRRRSAVTRGRRQRRPGRRRRALIAAAQERWGRLDGALISVGGPPTGPVADDRPTSSGPAAFESVFLGAVRLCARDRRGARARAARSPSCSRPACARRWPTWPISNGLRPGLAMVAKTLADELGPAGRPGQRAAARAGSAPSGSPSSTPSTGDAEAAARRRASDDPAAALRRAGGVRPGRGVPAVAGGVVRDRRRCSRSTAGCCARSDPSGQPSRPCRSPARAALRSSYAR